jgi:hypothetical protein
MDGHGEEDECSLCMLPLLEPAEIGHGERFPDRRGGLARAGRPCACLLRGRLKYDDSPWAGVALLGAGGCFLFATRLAPRRQRDEGAENVPAGHDYVTGRLILAFIAVIFSLGYGLWAMLTGSLD